MKRSKIKLKKSKDMIKSQTTIYVVEDDEGLNHLIQRALQRLGYCTTGYQTGSEAISRIEKTDDRNAILLLDFQLPGMTAKQVIETLAQKNLNVPFIIMTGHGDENIAVEMMKLGAKDYIIKDSSLLNILPQVLKRVEHELAQENKLKITERALIEQKEHYKELADSITDVFFALNKDLKITYWNKASTDLTGISTEDAVGKKLSEIFPENLATEKLIRIYQQVIEDQQPQSFLIDYYIDGNKYFIEFTVYPSNEGISVFGKDITDHKNLENVLLKSVDKLKAIFEGANDGILAINTETKKFGFANPRICELTGYTSQELIKLDMDKIHPEKDLPYVIDQFKKQVEGKVPLAKNIPILMKNKKVIYCDVNSRIIKINKKEYLVGFYRDITESKRAQDELRNSEERFKALFESAPDAIYLMDLEGNFVDGNKAAEDIIGLKRDEVIGKNMLDLDLLPQDQIENALGYLAKNIEGKPTGPDELILKRNDGSKIPVEIRTFPVRIMDQDLILGIARDITERKKWVDELERSFSITKATLESTDEGIVVVNKENKIKVFNRRFVDIWGLPESLAATGDYNQVMKCLIDQLVDPKDSKKINKKFIKNKAKESSDILETKNNTDHECTSKPQWVGDNVIGRVWSFRDITERKHAEEALLESENKYRTLVDNITDVVVEVDSEGNFSYASPQVLDVYGFSPEEITGTSAFEFIHPDDIEMAMEAMSEAITGKKMFSFEYRTRHKDGHYIYVSGSGKLVKKGGESKIVGVVRDITERKRAEVELKNTLVELERSNKELEQFAYIASHDLQEPLRMVSSYVQLLQRRYAGKLDAEADEFINYAVDGAKRMHELINDLLSYSRVASDGKEFKPTNTESILNEALSNLGMMVEDSGAKVTHDKLPSIKADGVQLAQLFQNLLSNAIKFHGKDAPNVHISAFKKDNDWLFSVQDNGIGLDQKYAERAFSIFQRLHSKEEYTGTGIGLAVCKRIVERHNGRIWFGSEPGAGTTFYFTIPINEGG